MRQVQCGAELQLRLIGTIWCTDDLQGKRQKKVLTGAGQEAI